MLDLPHFPSSPVFFSTVVSQIVLLLYSSICTCSHTPTHIHGITTYTSTLTHIHLYTQDGHFSEKVAEMSNLRWLRLNRSQLSLLPEEIDKFNKLVRVYSPLTDQTTTVIKGVK